MNQQTMRSQEGKKGRRHVLSPAWRIGSNKQGLGLYIFLSSTGCERTPASGTRALCHSYKSKRQTSRADDVCRDFDAGKFPETRIRWLIGGSQMQMQMQIQDAGRYLPSPLTTSPIFGCPRWTGRSLVTFWRKCMSSKWENRYRGGERRRIESDWNQFMAGKY